MISWVHQKNVQLYFGNLHFDIENFEQLFLLYGQLSLQEYIFDFDIQSFDYFLEVIHFDVATLRRDYTLEL